MDEEGEVVEDEIEMGEVVEDGEGGGERWWRKKREGLGTVEKRLEEVEEEEEEEVDWERKGEEEKNEIRGI